MSTGALAGNEPLSGLLASYSGTLSVEITAITGATLPARVLLSDPATQRQIGDALTESGAVTFGGLAQGTYLVSVRCAGVHPQTRLVTAT